MWNDSITLIDRKQSGKDKLKQPTYRENRLTIFCKKKSVTRSEFYQASQAGLRPSLVVRIHTFEYHDEEWAEYEGKKYRILKTYPIDLNEIELTLTEELT